jgi:hypothetical protein
LSWCIADGRVWVPVSATSRWAWSATTSTSRSRIPARYAVSNNSRLASSPNSPSRACLRPFVLNQTWYRVPAT